jgi:hypothetical protein
MKFCYYFWLGTTWFSLKEDSLSNLSMSTLTTIHNSSASIINNNNTATIHTDLNTAFSGQLTAVQKQLHVWKLRATGAR